MRDRQVRRGDIYYVDLSPVVGSEQGGMRPVINIQNAVGNKYSPTIIVAAITSRPKSKMPTHVLLDGIRGLEQDSVALLEQLRTIDKKRLLEYIGTADSQQIQRIDQALCISLGIRKKEDLMCISLCGSCANQFYDSEEYYIRRADMAQREKETCMFCNMRAGFDFIIKRKNPWKND